MTCKTCEDERSAQERRNAATYWWMTHGGFWANRLRSGNAAAQWYYDTYVKPILQEEMG